MKMLVIAVSLAGASAAVAADLPRSTDAIAPAPVFRPAPVFTWTGFYVGVNGGYSFGKFTETGDAIFGKASGGTVGGTLGYNYQIGSAVLGLEGDWGWTGARGERTLPGPAFANSRLTSLMTARGRVGYAFDQALVYATGGYAGGGIKAALNDTTLPPGAQNFSTSGWHHGWALGAGLEYAFSRNISIKGEYLYTKLETKPTFAPPRLIESGLQQNLLRAGVNYRF